MKECLRSDHFSWVVVIKELKSVFQPSDAAELHKEINIVVVAHPASRQQFHRQQQWWPGNQDSGFTTREASLPIAWLIKVTHEEQNIVVRPIHRPISRSCHAFNSGLHRRIRYKEGINIIGEDPTIGMQHDRSSTHHLNRDELVKA